MMFVRVDYDTDTGQVYGVHTSQTPFPDALPGCSVRVDSQTAPRKIASKCLGLVKFPAGETEASRIHEIVRDCKLTGQPGHDDLMARVKGKFRCYECPTTIPGLRNHVASKGCKSVHGVVRAWIKNIAPHHAQLLGIDVGIPQSVLKAAESIRAARTPNDSKGMVMERQIQGRADAALARRTEKSRAAWQADQDSKKQARELAKQGGR